MATTSTSTTSTTPPLLLRRRRPLPEKLLIAYATECNEGVYQAVQDGINVIIWSFMEIHQKDDGQPNIQFNSLDLNKIQQMIQRLDDDGYSDTVHLISFGGWNGPHLDTRYSAVGWFRVWKESVGSIFHGMDWDLEGHDDLNSTTNNFSMECLDLMGDISRLAQGDGYIIGMAPPQSYLDYSTSQFSRSVVYNNNYHEQDHRTWHADFQYFGANVYAYLLAKYGSYIDFVSIQFYESYSRAAMAIYHDKIPPDVYLQQYMQDLVIRHQEAFEVSFGDDPTVASRLIDPHHPSDTTTTKTRVSLPVSKVVWGFANGWALDTGDKALYVPPEAIQIAYETLAAAQPNPIPPRGFMFWVLGEEGGKHNIYYARALHAILRNRSSCNNNNNNHHYPTTTKLNCKAKGF